MVNGHHTWVWTIQWIRCPVLVKMQQKMEGSAAQLGSSAVIKPAPHSRLLFHASNHAASQPPWKGKHCRLVRVIH